MPGKHFQIPALDSEREASSKAYLEFLRSQSLSLGLYVLRAGQQDLQKPHTEDEVYYVMEGRARFKANGEDWLVQSGSVLFVEAGVEHWFYQIEEDLKVLVFFAPPERDS